MERSTISRCEPSSDARSAMRRGALTLVALALLATGECFADSPAPLIPLPAEVVPGQGKFLVSPRTVVRVPAGDAEAAEAARYLIEKVARTRGVRLAVAHDDIGADAAARAGAVARSSSVRRPGAASADSPAISFERE